MKTTQRLLIALAMTSSVALAQDSNNPGNDEEEVFTLSPFLVDGSKDSGYLASQTLAGTRLGDFSEPIISILSTLAKIERQKISERTKAGLERVRKSGTRLGRPSKVRMYRDDVVQLKAEGVKPREISRRLGISVPTVYECLKTMVS